MRLSRYGFAILFGFALFVFTGFLLADTFLIKRVYTMVEKDVAKETVVIQVEETETNVTDALEENMAEEETEQEPVMTETTYSDGNITVELTTYRVLNTTVYVADVWITSSDYLKTAFAESSYGRNITEKTSSIASSVNAILAVNGDYYGAQRSGYVIRNGVLYRSTSSGSEDLVIYADGSFGIINENEITAEELLESGAWNVLSFGPALVEEGTVKVSKRDEVGRAMASNPRTAIGIVDEGHYLFVVADGRTSESEGLSLYELATFMQSLGVSIAYNLDGGGSSSMVFLGTVINNPANGRGSNERSVSDIVYIGYDV